MDQNEAIEKLKDFNKHGAELMSLSFLKKMENSGFLISVSTEEGFKSEYRGPDDEAIKAFVNDLRRFFQKGEDTLKIHKLIPLYQEHFAPASAKKLFYSTLKQHEQLKKQIVSSTIQTKDENGNQKIITYTRQEILDIFLYGKFSHRSDEQNKKHDRFEKFEPLYLSFKNEFLLTMYSLALILNKIIAANSLFIDSLEN